MHIELNENSEKLLKMVLATGRYDSVDDIIAEAAAGDAGASENLFVESFE